MPGNSAQPQQGVVLLSVLLIVALLGAIAWQLVGRHSLVIAQARFSFTSDQALSYALGAEALARQLLYQEWLEGDNSRDTLLEQWAQPIAPLVIENGLMEIQVRDLNGCFNLNSLSGDESERNLARFKVLLRNSSQPESIADAWKDWVDADQEVTGFGAEDGEYLLLDDPYRTADAPAVHISEFKLIRGLEAETLEALLPSLCLLGLLLGYGITAANFDSLGQSAPPELVALRLLACLATGYASSALRLLLMPPAPKL